MKSFPVIACVNMETVSEMLDTNFIFTRLIAQEGFIEPSELLKASREFKFLWK
jgi:hypothetical protein